MSFTRFKKVASSSCPPSLCKNKTQLTASLSSGCNSRLVATLEVGIMVLALATC
jgi:hypothetical protein